MGHFLNFGAGPNQLPPPWQNLNAEHDIRKPLKFEDGSAARILAEHVIEHVPYLQGFGFLQECYRVLHAGGVLRLAFPDPAALLAVSVDTAERAPFYALGSRCAEYAAHLMEHANGVYVRDAADKPRAALVAMLIGWSHQSAWTLHTAAATLCAVGFGRVLQRKYREGALGEFDGHHKDVGEKLALMETTVLEVTK